MKKLLPAACILLALLPALSHAQGDITTPTDLAGIPLSPGLTTKESLPQLASLSLYTAPAGEQGLYSTCTAWSMAMARSICYAYKKKITNRDSLKKYFFSPAFLYYNIRNKKDTNCSEGSRISDAIRSLKEKGIVWQHTAPEACADKTDPGLYKDALQYRIKDGNMLNRSEGISEETVMEIKKAIAHEHPVVISMGYFSSFTRIGTTGIWQPSPNDTPSTTQAHAMCIIGYNDAVNGGVVEVVNSWGPSWGNQGHAWLSYEQLKKYGKYAIEVTDYPEPASWINGKLLLQLPNGSALNVTKENGTNQLLPHNIDHYSVLDRFPDTLKIRFAFQCSAPGYLYLLSDEENDHPYTLFPDATTTTNQINPEEGKSFLWPMGEEWYKFPPQGKRRIWVIFSLTPLQLNNSVKQYPISLRTGQLADLIKTQCISKEKITSKPDALGFRSRMAPGQAICFSIWINT